MGEGRPGLAADGNETGGPEVVWGWPGEALTKLGEYWFARAGASLKKGSGFEGEVTDADSKGVSRAGWTGIQLYQVRHFVCGQGSVFLVLIR